MHHQSVERLSTTLLKPRVGIVEFIKDCSGQVLMICALSLKRGLNVMNDDCLCLVHSDS